MPSRYVTSKKKKKNHKKPTPTTETINSFDRFQYYEKGNSDSNNNRT